MPFFGEVDLGGGHSLRKDGLVRVEHRGAWIERPQLVGVKNTNVRQRRAFPTCHNTAELSGADVVRKPTNILFHRQAQHRCALDGYGVGEQDTGELIRFEIATALLLDHAAFSHTGHARVLGDVGLRCEGTCNIGDPALRNSGSCHGVLGHGALVTFSLLSEVLLLHTLTPLQLTKNQKLRRLAVWPLHGANELVFGEPFKPVLNLNYVEHYPSPLISPTPVIPAPRASCSGL